MGRNNGGRSDVLYIACRVEPGMFRGELLAVAEVLNPENPDNTVRAQLLVDQRDVVGIVGVPKRNNPAKGWLRVGAVRKEKGLLRIVFPQPASPVGETAYVEEGAAKQGKEVGV